MKTFLKVVLIVLAVSLISSLLLVVSPLKKEDRKEFEVDPNHDPTAEPRELTFKINDAEFTYRSDMTFGEWVASDYESAEAHFDETTSALCFMGSPVCDSYGFLYSDNLIIGIEELSVNSHISVSDLPSKDTTVKTMEYTNSAGDEYTWSYEAWMRFSDFMASDKYDSTGFGFLPGLELVRLGGKPVYSSTGHVFLGSPCSDIISDERFGLSFEIDGKTYNYLGGMTWSDFLMSEYNTDGFYLDSEGKIFNPTGDKILQKYTGDYPDVMYSFMYIFPERYIWSVSYQVNVNGEMYEYDVGMTWDEFYEKYPQCSPEPEGSGGNGGGMEEPGPS